MISKNDPATYQAENGWADLALGNARRAHWFNILVRVPYPLHGLSVSNDLGRGISACGKFYAGYFPRVETKARCKTCERAVRGER